MRAVAVEGDGYVACVEFLGVSGDVEGACTGVGVSIILIPTLPVALSGDRGGLTQETEMNNSSRSRWY